MKQEKLEKNKKQNKDAEAATDDRFVGAELAAGGVKAAMKAAKHAAGRGLGLPGMGPVKATHGHGHHGSNHGDTMTHAEDVMPPERAHFFNEITEGVFVFNCFFLAYYIMFIGTVLLPSHYAHMHVSRSIRPRHSHATLCYSIRNSPYYTEGRVAMIAPPTAR
jgi:hypothetical protein